MTNHPNRSQVYRSIETAIAAQFGPGQSWDVIPIEGQAHMWELVVYGQMVTGVEVGAISRQEALSAVADQMASIERSRADYWKSPERSWNR